MHSQWKRLLETRRTPKQIVEKEKLKKTKFFLRTPDCRIHSLQQLNGKYAHEQSQILGLINLQRGRGKKWGLVRSFSMCSLIINICNSPYNWDQNQRF